MYYQNLAEACALGRPDKNYWKYFKQYEKELPRIIKVLGILKSINPNSVLDVGSGRGRSLWPMVYNFPNTKFMCIDKFPFRAEVIQAVHDGGIKRVSSFCGSISDYKSNEKYDVVTALEVMEHIPEVQDAMDNIVKLCKKYYIASVPSKPDNNPDHIHLFSEQSFANIVEKAVNKNDKKIKKLTFEYVPKHMIVFLYLGEE